MNLRDIQLRIRSVRKTQQITRAMKMVAAVKFRQAQNTLLNARPYSARLREIAARVLALDDVAEITHPLTTRHAGPRRLLLLFASDKGLCGSFNHNVHRAAQRFLHDGKTAAGATSMTDLWLVGRKIHDEYKSAARAGRVLGNLFRFTPAQDADARTMARELAALFASQQYYAIDVVYTRFQSVLQSHAQPYNILPIDPAKVISAQPGASAWPLSEPGLPAIVEQLWPRLLESDLRQFLLESAAAEQGTRMNMMEQATKNAEDLIEELMQDFNKARQWNITRELTDLTTGVEAME